MKFMGHAACMGDIKNVNIILVGKPHMIIL
jgi:hypothetical protein